MLWLGLVGTALSLFISFTMDTLDGMWLAAIPSSLLNHNASVLKALFADYAADAKLNDVDRVSAMGKLGMAVGASFMVGPALSTVLASSYQGALRIAAVAACISAIFFAMLPPVSASVTSSMAMAKLPKREPGSTQILSTLQNFFHLPVLKTGGARLIIAIRLFAGLAFNIYQVLWQSSLKLRFAFGPSDYAIFAGVVGLSYALSQGLVARELIRRSKGNPTALALCCVVLLGIGRPLALWTHDIRVVYVVFTFMVMALGVLNTLISSACANLATGDEVCGLFGFLDAVENVTGIIGPLLGGTLASAAGPGATLAVVVGMYVLNFAIIALFYNTHVVLAQPAAKKFD
ncbi:major facilitator superfamily domain-containing protein [Pavlovales sp. CCMP2436]|nr:major facilitator superfamily domain-containing protein [Pavlovales sp. CCMP2436]